jgi:hypothetical protein
LSKFNEEKSCFLTQFFVGCSLPDKDVFVYRLRDKIENMHKELDELNKNYLILGGQYAYKIINGLMKK